MGGKCGYELLGFAALHMHKFAHTLEKVEVECCGDECPIRLTLSALLPLCHKLTELVLGYIQEAEGDEAQGNHVPVLASLVNMSVKKIRLYDYYSPINGEHLAAVCNSAKDHCLSNISINCAFSGVHFQLAEFCQSLEPAAALAIRSLSFHHVRCGWVELLPTFPAVFPNLASVDLIEECPKDATAEVVMKMAQAVGEFLHAPRHKKPVTLKLEIDSKNEPAFGRWLWDAINLIEVWRSGTKRTADMQHWARTLAHGNVTLSIKV